MLDFDIVFNNKDYCIAQMKKRGFKIDYDKLLKLERKRKELIRDIESLQKKRNELSKNFICKEGQEKNVLREESLNIGKQIAIIKKDLSLIEKDLNYELSCLPNVLDNDVPEGGKEDNIVLKINGEKPVFTFKPLSHVELSKNLGLIDYERGAKLSGSGFWVYRNLGAQLEWALLNFFINEHLNDGYEFILPPHQLNYDCGFGAGQFPKFNEEVYWIDSLQEQEKSRFLLPTAETALVNLYSNEILTENQLPLKFFAYTPCFRREAGSYRAEERGMVRGHQFNKVEMVQYTSAEGAMTAFNELVQKAENLLKKLGLHFRTSKLAAGDCSESMRRTYDIEIWIPSMGIYKEVSSVSCAGEFQTRRNNTRYRSSKDGKLHYVYTLNGSGLATSRVFPALLEQCQNADGSVTIPQVLRPYLGGKAILSANK